MAYEGIAIIGMSGRFPGAKNIEEYWENLKAGQDGISFFTKEDAKEAGVNKEYFENNDYVFAGGILEDVEYFDEGFFGMTPREAADMDPQQRLFLECSYEALEDAGYAKEEYTEPVGVFAGANMSTYFLYHLASKIGVRDDFPLAIGNDKDYIATRTSYIFNLKGPSISVQTACSTSMTAVAMACDSLDSYQCDMAVAGGATVKLPQKMGYLYQDGMIYSPDGYTRPFDEGGTGTVFTSAVGVVILKRLEDAVRDRDHIYAVIKGIAVNNDGSDKVGFTAPSREGQAKVIETAQYLAGVSPEDIGYMEAHGTGTKLGDPIEISALSKVFSKSTGKRGYCAIGSVKGNIGHAVSGAGISGLIKAALAVKYGEIPPNIHFNMPNPEIDFINSPFYVNTRLRKWEEKEKPRTAGISSFGFGGTNVHAVLQEFHENTKDNACTQPYLLTLSAGSEKVLLKMRERLAEFLKNNSGLSFADTIFTLHVGRKSLEYRLAFVCKDMEEAASLLLDTSNEKIIRGKAAEGRMLQEKPAFLKDDLEALGKYWVTGGIVDWESFHAGEANHRISLPSYPFDKKRHWVEQYRDGQDENKEKSFVSSEDPKDWLYGMNFRRTDMVKPVFSENLPESRWLIFMDEIGFGEQLCAKLSLAGAKVSKVYSGINFSQYNEEKDSVFIINERKKEDYLKLFGSNLLETTDYDYIVHLFSVTESRGNLISPADIDESMYKSFYSLLFLVQAIHLNGNKDKMKLAVITNHMHVIAGEDQVHPEKSLVLGPCKVIPKEYGNISCQSIDLDITEDNLCRKHDTADHVIAEILSENPEFLVAYRGPFRWIQTSEKLYLNYDEETHYERNGATYLITGGLGGIGYHTAKYLTESGRVNLILTGRSRVPADSPKLRQLADMGANVMYIPADCTDAAQMREVFESGLQKYGKINGIFHAAGIADTCEIADKTVESVDKVLSPKVKGTLVLHEWIRKCNPEFAVLFSSTSAILGNAGFIDYTSANGFLDAYAWYWHLSGNTKVISINWEKWNDVGMGSDDLKHRVKSGIPVKEGLIVMDRIIRAKQGPQVIVSPGDFLSMLEDIHFFMLGGDDGRTDPKISKPEEENRPELKTPYMAPQNQTQEIIADIWEKLLGVYPVGIRDDYFELGGHSLLATTMISELSKEFRINISLRDIFERSTVEELALLFNDEEGFEDIGEYIEGEL